MKKTINWLLTGTAAAFLLSACGGDEAKLVVGSKDFGESMILANMVAALAESENIAVERKIPLGDTRTNLEALKRGDIDVYPEYNGTGLIMLGQPAMADGDAATDRVQELYQPLGLRWGERLGFANNYGLAITSAKASELGINKISDLVSLSEPPSIGIETNFEKRPLDGFSAMNRRYGINFDEVEVVSSEERSTLYDKLLEEQVDVIEVFTTDGQIADYNLVLLEDDLAFFPVYQAAPLLREDALQQFPGLLNKLNELAGKLDAATMQDLNRRVDLGGQDPAAVARAALAEMGLIDVEASFADSEELNIAVPALLQNDAVTASVLRAARQAFSGRPVELVNSEQPLQAVANDEARLALVSAEGFFDLDQAIPTRNENFEAVGLVGENILHLITTGNGPLDVGQASKLLVPGGTNSEAIAKVILNGMNSAAELVAQDVDSVDALLQGLDAESVALLFLPLNHQGIADAFKNGNYRLRSIKGWEQGNNLVRFPFLRQARISAQTYASQLRAIDTLSSQLVLAGPAPVDNDAIGDAGPGGGIVTQAGPVSNSTVKALNKALDQRVQIDPVLRQARALLPELPQPPASVNPSPEYSALNLGLTLLIIWFLWMYSRPERR